MRVPILRSAAAGLLALGLAAPVVSASTRVEIVLDNHFLTTGVETFTASGFCPSGSAVTSNLVIVGGSHGLTFHLDKTLTCNDGSGTLSIHVDAATSYGTYTGDQGGWSVTGGTGAWAGATGGGQLVATYTSTGSLDDYTGALRP
ncbi:MAG TPA: hypothetical protein VF802_06110 [Candidatus Limnocylindrales bacterium]